MSSREFAVRVGQDEIGRILDLKGNLDHSGLWLDYVARYLSLGWDLVPMSARGTTELGLDFSQPQEVWSQKLTELGLDEMQLNVAIRTGKSSRLLVLEVNQGEGALPLDQLGEWRSECVAEVGNSREQHYYALPPERLAPPSFFQAPQVLIYGEGGLVLAPPSLETQGREPWRWRQPPWEATLRYPKPAVWHFIREHVTLAAETENVAAQVLPWERVYPIIAPHGMVLKCLLVPAPSLEAYYYGVLTTAMGVGITDPEVLLSLLWHAPHGDCRTRPGRWEYLQDLVAAKPLVPLGENGLSEPRRDPDLPAAMAALGAWSFSEKAMAEAGLNPADPSDSGRIPEWFDPSLPGQFFKLLAGLGEKVIMESCRYEALRSGMGMASVDYKRRAGEWDRRYCPGLPAPAEAGAVPGDKQPDGSGDIAQAWASVMPAQAAQSHHRQEIQAAAQEFLEQNQDLAEDRQTILMVIFCLKNYIAINPEYAALNFKEKLAKAGKMARGFLGQDNGP